jgi:DNA-binding transcriptional ArsR family regulator
MKEPTHNEVEDKARKKIECYLAKNQKASTNQISEGANLAWATVQKHLDYLESIGRVHSERLGNSMIYFFNGNGKWQKKVRLDQDHILFLDTFVSQHGKPFIRIKEAKKKAGKWENFGDVMITKEKVSEVKAFLEIVEKNLDIYR